MGEKTTIEIENMRELKQHALDTSKTLKQIINEAIAEKIAKERKKLGLSGDLPKGNIVEGVLGSDDAADEISGSKAQSENSSFDPEILEIIQKVFSRHGLEISDISNISWSDELESDIKTTLESVYDEIVASDVIQQLKRR